jgi:hypothetical protein
MPSADRKLELKAKRSVAQTSSQPFVYSKGLIDKEEAFFKTNVCLRTLLVMIEVIPSICNILSYLRMVREINSLVGGYVCIRVSSQTLLKSCHLNLALEI